VEKRIYACRPDTTVRIIAEYSDFRVDSCNHPHLMKKGGIPFDPDATNKHYCEEYAGVEIGRDLPLADLQIENDRLSIRHEGGGFEFFGKIVQPVEAFKLSCDQAPALDRPPLSFIIQAGLDAGFDDQVEMSPWSFSGPPKGGSFNIAHLLGELVGYMMLHPPALFYTSAWLEENGTLKLSNPYLMTPQCDWTPAFRCILGWVDAHRPF